MQKTSLKGIFKKELQNGDVSWFIKCRLNGNPTTIKIGNKVKDKLKTEQDAYKFYLRQQATQKITSQEETIIQPSTPNLSAKYTLNDLAQIYYDKKKSKIKRLLKEQYTHLSDEEFQKLPLLKIKLDGAHKEVYIYNKNVRETALGKMNIEKITISEIDTFLEDNLGKTQLTQKSKFNLYANLKTIVNYANKHNLINIQNPFKKNLKNPRRARERVLNPDEIKLLLDEAKKHNMNIYMPIYLAILTGGRANTILNIRKKDINLVEKSISLSNIKATKKYKLPLNDKAVKWFSKILIDYADDEYLVRPERPHLRYPPYRQMMSIPDKVYDLMDTLFNQKLNKQNNNDRDNVVNFHSLRRSIATNLAREGTPLYDVMIFLNHSSIDQTMKYLNMTSTNLGNSHNALMSKIFIEY